MSHPASQHKPLVPRDHVDNSSDEDDGDAQQPLAAAAPAAARPLDTSLLSVLRASRAAASSSPSFLSSSGGGRIALCALFLGALFASGLHWGLLLPHCAARQVGAWVACMALFHTMEFMWQATFHPEKLSAQSFLLNHSREYHLALAAGLIEYALEWLLFPSLKYPSLAWPLWLGLLVTLGGQVFRSVAMFTAASNFTHIVAEWKEPNHQLVTHGIYAVCRHPSYAGWWAWSVGTQIMLANPLCACAYAHEERAMLGFFGDEYVRYQKAVPSGVPFVKGFGL